MPGRCVIGGCSNTQIELAVALHCYPADQTLWPLWDKFVKKTRKDFVCGNKLTIVCSTHFCESDFENLFQWKNGGAKCLRLKKDAIPSILPPKKRSSSKEKNYSAPKKPRGSRKVLEVKLDLGRTKPKLTEANQEAATCASSVTMEVEGNLPNDCDANTTATSWCSQSTQAAVSVEHKSIQCGLLAAPPLERIVTANCQVKRVETPAVVLPEARPEAHLEDKFIVFYHELMDLFKTCPLCASPATASISKTQGTCIIVQQFCTSTTCGHRRRWTSQPFIGKMPLGNLLVSSAILFSGSLPTKALRFIQLMKVQSISISTFYRHQRHYLFPVVESHWQQEQQATLAELTDRETLVLIGDGRSDSPGHSAKYGCYTVIEQGIQKVLDIQIVQSNEVKNASWCELEGLKRTTQFLEDQQLRIKTLVTDRHPQISKWLREEHPAISHRFDIWHVAKGLNKKLDKLSGTRGCEDVALWKKSIRNHLYWSAMSTPNNIGDIIQQKWSSLLYHIQDVHDSLPFEHLPACQHGQLAERQWLEPTSQAYASLEKVLLERRFLADVSKMSTGEQTASLEAFHSLIIHFAPKHTAFSWLGMRSRLRLAALHFNENSKRSQARILDGELRYNVYYSKAKNFEPRVRPVATSHTINYAVKLQELLLSKYCQGPRALRDSLTSLHDSQPAPLSDKAQRITKEAAVDAHISRFKP